jgi:pimeloyl-ACP methyl ester carboxylesterase
MFGFMTARRSVVALIAAVVAVFMAPVSASAAVTTLTGTLPDGATYLIEVPSGWNGTLLLYSHGYTAPGSANPAHDVGDPATGAYLLAHGYALAGSSYAGTGWALKEAIPDQIATLDQFAGRVGHPTRTIAWGHSLGGIITAGLLQTHPDRFTAALPMCGVVAGGVGTWNQGLDGEFAIQQLLGSGTALQVVNLTNPGANFGLAEQILTGAQSTLQGRARIALAAALSDVPGWFNPASPEPAATDFTAQEANQYLWISQVDAAFLFFLRAELEARAGGNPSWNTGVNYESQLNRSVDAAEVRALYQQAGLSLDADLDTLNKATRISANPAAVTYLTKNIVFNGQLGGKPVLTIHTTGDGLVVNTDEQAYRSAVQEAGNSRLLREAFVHRAGHCTFTPAETIAALKALEHRINTGKWGNLTDPESLNAAAAALGALNVAPPSYLDFKVAPFLRPFDLAREHQDQQDQQEN